MVPGAGGEAARGSYHLLGTDFNSGKTKRGLDGGDGCRTLSVLDATELNT